MLFSTRRRIIELKVGDQVRVRQLLHSPLSGEVGTIVNVSPADVCGAYLVRFGQGLQFRYSAGELEHTVQSAKSPLAAEPADSNG